MGLNTAASEEITAKEGLNGYDVRTIDLERLKQLISFFLWGNVFKCRIWMRDPYNLAKKIEYYEESVRNDKASLFFRGIARDSGNLERMVN